MFGLFKSKQERELEKEMKYQEIMREITIAENKLDSNRDEVIELGKRGNENR